VPEIKVLLSHLKGQNGTYLNCRFEPAVNDTHRTNKRYAFIRTFRKKIRGDYWQ
jgi:hypothetical protein